MTYLNRLIVTAGLVILTGTASWLLLKRTAVEESQPAKPAALEDESRAEHPMPLSTRELLNNLTPYAAPADVEMMTEYKGYSHLEGRDPLRFYINFPVGKFRMNRQTRAGKEQSWDSADLQLFHFKGDPNSLVLRLPDKTIIFLKYTPQLALAAYPQTLRAWVGWVIRPQTRAKPAKIVLVENVNPDWPRALSLKEAMPQDLHY
jgi:hypothetical protein